MNEPFYELSLLNTKLGYSISLSSSSSSASSSSLHFCVPTFAQTFRLLNSSSISAASFSSSSASALFEHHWSGLSCSNYLKIHLPSNFELDFDFEFDFDLEFDGKLDSDRSRRKLTKVKSCSPSWKEENLATFRNSSFRFKSQMDRQSESWQTWDKFNGRLLESVRIWPTSTRLRRAFSEFSGWYNLKLKSKTRDYIMMRVAL